MSAAGGAPATRALAITHGNVAWGVGRFGVPLVVGMLLYSLFNLIDMFMVSRLENGAEALAALGVCDMVFALVSILATGVSNGSVAIIARRLGEGDRAGLDHAAMQSLLLMAAGSILFGVAGVLLAGPLASDLMQTKGEVAELATDYLEVMLGGCFSMFFLLQVTAILRALGHAKSAAVLLVAGNALNVVLNAILIYGPGPHPDVFAWARPLAEQLGVPRMGLVGSAWATLVGRAAPALAGIVMLLAYADGLRPTARDLLPDRAQLTKLLRVGLPASAQLALRVLVVLVFIGLVAAHYTTVGDASVLTAYSVCLRLEVAVLFVALGWGAAASTWVGVNLGAGKPARALRAGWIAGLYGALSAALMVAGFWAYAESVMGFFDPSPAVVAAGSQYLTIVGASYVALALGVVLSQSMVGAGATFRSLLLDAAVLLCAVTPAALIVPGVWGGEPTALWAVVAVGNVVAALVFAAAFARGGFVRTAV